MERKTTMHLLYIAILINQLFFVVRTNELLASNKTTIIENYYNLLLNNEVKTSASNVIKVVSSVSIDLKKLIIQHENLHLLQINNNDLFFQNNNLNLKPYCVYSNDYLKKLKIINLSNNNIKNITFSNSTFCKFQNLKYVDLSYNKLKTIYQDQFNGFKIYGELNITVNIELLKLDHNEITFIKSDTFNNFIKLKYLDLSYNKLKYLHPLVVNTLNTELLDLSNNFIEELYKKNYDNLKYLYLNSKDLKLKCDCLLTDLLTKYKSNQIFIDDFYCYLNKEKVLFKTINEIQLNNECKNKTINIYYKVEKGLEKSSVYSYLAVMAHKWFTWYVWKENTITDVLPKIPLLIDDNNNNNINNYTNNKLILNLTANYLSDINIKCEETKISGSPSNSTVIWKTPFGYFSNNEKIKLFHKMSNLTKIYRHLRFNTGPHRLSGANTINDLYISNNSELILTKFRQLYTGEYTCFVINPVDYSSITFNLNSRTGVSDYFFYCIVVSIISSMIPSIIGIILCIVCEKKALDSFPMTPPVFPTPLGSVPMTPPNFDFNQWMTNTASNIQGTLDLASKRLRKGLEKASTTVKSIGVTSTAYFYSVYEQSSQRLHTIKSYRLPTLPTVSLPTMRYPNQLATRMGRLRTGVADYLLQFREFCGTSDLTHTASIATIASETNASNAVGYIVGKVSHMDKSMNYIAEEGNLNEEQMENNVNEINSDDDDNNYERITKLNV